MRTSFNAGDIESGMSPGETFTTRRRGVRPAEIRPLSDPHAPQMPDREALIMSGPLTVDSGLGLEEDRG